MAHTSRTSLSGLVAILFLFLLVAPVRAAWNEAYCSSQNTGSTDVYTQQFMSNGNCTDHCRNEGTYAFAVIQYKDCYCSDLIPRQQASIGDCRKICPGYQAENCGSIDDGLFIYIQNGKPSGTAPGPSSAQPTTPTSSKPPPSKPTNDPGPSPTESVQVVTESGSVITRVITLIPSSTPTTSSAPVELKNDNGPNIGAIAGGVAGGVIGILAIIGGIIFFLWRRRKQQHQRDLDEHNGGGSGGITRNTSTMSKAGLLGGASTAGQHYPPHIATNMSTQNSRFGADQDSLSPSSNRRNSQPLVIDSRLNPNAVMTFAGANLSRESVTSLDDSRDYGRQLNVRNPDPHY